MLKYFTVLITGFIISISLLVMLRRLALKFRILASRDIALVGGIGIGIAVVLSSLLGIFIFGKPMIPIVPVVAISVVILIFGIMDDLREATVSQKFLLQFLCASLLIAIDIRTHIIYLNYWGNIIITLFWILGITNALNLLDIIDGLSSGVALIVATSLFVISSFNYDINIQILSLGLTGAILGCLLFNIPPARIYLGNSGSHFLGFIFAALTLLMSYATIDTPMALLSPIIILWLALLESAFLIYFRLKKGIIPFNKSDDHIALRLIALGFSKRAVLYFMLVLQLFFALCGIIIIRVNNSIAVIIVLLVLMVSVGLFQSLRRIEPNAG